jgi:hypothetical protein
MAGKEPLELEIKYDPAGKDLLVYMICSGIATGSYTFHMNLVDGTTLSKEGNIEKPERYTIPIANAPKSIHVTIQSKSFFAEDPGTYHIVFHQEGHKEQLSPEMVDDADLTIQLTPAQEFHSFRLAPNK